MTRYGALHTVATVSWISSRNTTLHLFALREYHGRYPLKALGSPLMFYNKHLGQKLLLKRVRFLPSLLTDLARELRQSLGKPQLQSVTFRENLNRDISKTS